MPDINKEMVDRTMADLKRWESQASATKNDKALNSVENIQAVIKGLTGRK